MLKCPVCGRPLKRGRGPKAQGTLTNNEKDFQVRRYACSVGHVIWVPTETEEAGK